MNDIFLTIFDFFINILGVINDFFNPLVNLTFNIGEWLLTVLMYLFEWIVDIIEQILTFFGINGDIIQGVPGGGHGGGGGRPKILEFAPVIINNISPIVSAIAGARGIIAL